jgi:hypothetical protein
MHGKPNRLRWSPILARAARLVADSVLPMTSRVVFYRLVSEAEPIETGEL